MRRVVNRMGCQKGSATVVEATLVFPIVFAVLAILIYMGYYQLQKASLYFHAQKIAVYSARVVGLPGYEKLAEAPDNSADLHDDWTVPGKKTVESIMSQHDPYRYWNFQFDKKGAMESYLDSLIRKYTLLQVQNLNYSVTYQNNVINQKFVVKVSGGLKMPTLVKNLLGVEEILPLEAEASALVDDQAEFIRNVDMAFDLTEFLAEKYKLNEKIGGVMQRVKDTLAKLGKS